MAEREELFDEWYDVDELLGAEERLVELERDKLIQELDEQDELLLKRLRWEAMFGGWKQGSA